MRRIVVAIAAASMLGPALSPAPAQVRSGPANPDVKIEYGPVKEEGAKTDGVRRRLQDGRVLERLAEFLWPLQLRRELTITAQECGRDRQRYEIGSQRAVLCYEVVDKLERAALRAWPKDEKRQRIVVVGAFVQAALHEVAHAIFDQLQIPVWGRMDDAADRLAALIMVMFDEEAARTTITGTADALAFGSNGEAWTGSGFASLGSPELQRRFNFFCIAHASDPHTFAFLVNPKRPLIPASRQRFCRMEYEEIRRAFNLRIMPHIDPDRLVQIRTRRWLP
jgi:hypothetical protein